MPKSVPRCSTSTSRQDLRVEPSGAASVAALLAGRYRPQGPVAVIASGGNVDDAVFARFLEG